jgi:hypothetical protein
MREETIASAVLLAGVAALLIGVVATGNSGERQARGAAAGGRPAAQAVDEQAVARFWAAIAEHQPHFEPVAQVCPVDGAALDVPALIDTNRLGGVATDMMQLALAPNPDGTGPPDITRQGFAAQFGSCPKCGATFTELDISVMNAAPVRAKLAGWDLGRLAPALAKRPQAQWTADERALVRFMTQQQAGLSQVELGISALQGAYCCNLAVAAGIKRRFVSPAFYALAASCFSQGQSDADKPAASFAAMMLGECSRLLGRADEAQAAYAQARKLGGLEPEAQAVLKQLEQLLKKGDFNLERAELPGLAMPPVNWYLDPMLPAINGDISVTRTQWAAYPDTAAVLQAMLQQEQ